MRRKWSEPDSGTDSNVIVTDSGRRVHVPWHWVNYYGGIEHLPRALYRDARSRVKKLYA